MTNNKTGLQLAAKQSMDLLGFLKNYGYNGMVVSEALPEYQTRESFEILVGIYTGIEDPYV